MPTDYYWRPMADVVTHYAISVESDTATEAEQLLHQDVLALHCWPVAAERLRTAYERDPHIVRRILNVTTYAPAGEGQRSLSLLWF